MQSTQENNQKMLQYIATSPVAVPNNLELKKETAEKELERYEKIASLSPRKRLALSHFSNPQKIQAIGQKYQFELLRLANITRLIREYYFGEVRLENFPAEIEKRMGVSLLTAQEITRYIKSEIIDWDPWAQYLAKLPKMPIRDIIQQYPKIAETEITAGYIELKNSDDLEDPSIKNWLKDYISHLGYDPHSQMDRTQYMFHSENGKNLGSQDREKLGIILKSFDENIPLLVDEENGEIVFDGIENVGGAYMRPETVHPAPAANTKAAYTRPLREEQKLAPQTTNNFIKPYAPISRPTLPPQPLPSQPQPTSPQPSPYKGEGVRPNLAPQSQPIANIPDNFASQAGKEEINKYFSAPETPDIPPIKIHSITEHNEPRVAPQQIVQRPVSPRPISAPPQPTPTPRPKHRMIEPFGPKMVEPRLDGNIVDLSERE